MQRVTMSWIIALATAVSTGFCGIADEKPDGWASVNLLGQNGTTGGIGGPVIPISDFTTLQNEAKKDGPKILMINGKIDGGSVRRINVMSNISIIGAGNNASINFELKLRGNNIIIRNLDISNGGMGDTEGYDGIGVGEGNEDVPIHHVWVDHCTIHDCPDGAVDPTYDARFFTISYNRFYNQNKTLLVGDKDDDVMGIAAQSSGDMKTWMMTCTIHHNWFEKTGQRHRGSGSARRTPITISMTV